VSASDRFRSYEASRYYEERVRELGSNSASEGFGLLFDYIHDPARTDKELDALFGPMRLLMGRCQDIQSVRREEQKGRSECNVMPTNDLKEHEDGIGCWCRPERHPEFPNIIIHNSLDRREDFETGKRRPA
jgi:hypothetical protein